MMNLDDLKQSLTDLKNLNPKTPGAWPWSAKIIAFLAMFIAVVVAGAFFIWQDQWAITGQGKTGGGPVEGNLPE